MGHEPFQNVIFVFFLVILRERPLVPSLTTVAVVNVAVAVFYCTSFRPDSFWLMFVSVTAAVVVLSVLYVSSLLSSCREVAVEGDHAYVRLGRAELEEALRSTEAALEKSRGRHAEAIRRAVVERDALKAEVERLR